MKEENALTHGRMTNNKDRKHRRLRKYYFGMYNLVKPRIINRAKIRELV